MIFINLAPPEELENKQWYVPDLLLFLLISLATYGSVQFFLGQLQEKIELRKSETQDFTRSYQKLKPDLERFAKLSSENDLLIKKLNSLKQITVSKIARYKPIIILEYLQNLKPDGVWFSHLYDDTDNNIIRLVGGALDNLLIAEFMASLAATRYQEVDTSDLRTQVYFSNVYLERVATQKQSQLSNKNLKKQKNPIQNAELSAFKATQDTQLLESKGSSFWQSSSKIFPELSSYPGFELNIKYEERAASDQGLAIDSELMSESISEPTSEPTSEPKGSVEK